MSKVIFREAKLHDLSGMKEVNERCLAENYPLNFWKDTWETNKKCCFVALVSNIVVGYILCNVTTVVSFAVDVKYRQNHIGTNLLRLSLNNFLNGSSVSLNVRQNNESALKLYQSHNFKEQTVIINYYLSPVENAIEMTRQNDSVQYPVVSKCSLRRGT